jgi:hypothetical protein
MQRLNDIRDRLVIFRDERGAILSKILAGGLVIACLAGAYLTGKRVERQWWRSQIAEKSAAANNIMSKLDIEAPDHDERLIKEWSRHEVDSLRAAERAVEDARRRAQSQPPAAPDDPCHPMPAHCLRR